MANFDIAAAVEFMTDTAIEVKEHRAEMLQDQGPIVSFGDLRLATGSAEATRCEAIVQLLSSSFALFTTYPH